MGYVITSLPGGLQQDSTVTDSQEPARGIQATYDASQLLTVPLYQIRFYAADTTPESADFSDSELLMCLAAPEANNNVRLAAAIALEALAADRARVAAAVKKGTRGNDESQVYQALLSAAARLRRETVMLAVVAPTVQQFSIGNCELGTHGTMDNW